jgi:histidinol-phosphate phosphatase family protein
VARRCVFLDRDGVINVKAPPHDYIRRWEDFTLIPAVVDWIRLFNALDLLVIVITNQRGIARGMMSQADAGDIHARMRELLASRGARIDDVFCCPHEDGACDCRKPLPGLVYAARDKWDIDLGASLMVGDSASDEELASRCGLRFVAVRDGRIVDSLG